jgi:uncharacterized membrane protein YkoI
LYAVAAVVAAGAIGAGVYAAQSQDSDALAIATARIDLIQAITAAEQHVGGKAVSAEFEREKDQLFIEVEVIRDRIVMEVTIDAQSGAIVSAVEEKDDD